MATKRFLLCYPDGSNAFIKTAERDVLLNQGSIEHIDSYRYRYTAQPRTFHAFADLESIRQRFEPQQEVRRFLEGRFIFELGDKRYRELMETPEGMVVRLQTA